MCLLGDNWNDRMLSSLHASRLVARNVDVYVRYAYVHMWMYIHVYCT
jgi:hypothetical protein